MRVRQEAQFALAGKGKSAVKALIQVAKTNKNQLARIHAIWGLGQVGRADGPASIALWQLCKDADDEVRVQAARVLGQAGMVSLINAKDLWPLLKDSSPRVRFAAAMALSHVKWTSEHYDPLDAKPVIDMLGENADRDPYLRHAGVMALAAYPAPEDLIRAGSDPSPAVRVAVLLALRRLAAGRAQLYDLTPPRAARELGRFLTDPEPRIAAEAARAIHDEPLPAALPQLAAMLERSNQPEFLLWRALNANFRLGKAEHAAAVAAFAARANAPVRLRVEAIKMLGDWAKPGRRDRVTGLTQDLGTRDSQLAPRQIERRLGGIFSGPEELRQEAARVSAKLGIKEAGPTLLALFSDRKSSAMTRVEAIKALDTLQNEHLPQAMKVALADQDQQVRMAGLRLMARLQPRDAVDALQVVLDKGKTTERQGALALLGEINNPAADKLLADWLDRLLAGKAPAEIQLDLLQASAKRQAEEVKHRLAKFEAARPKNDHLANYRETLYGGDAETGRRIFLYKTEVAFLRCHKVKGEGGDVGPDLTGIGTRQKREYLLESIVDPNRQIAKGFETVLLEMKNGQTVAGIIKEEDAKQVRLVTPEGRFLTVAKNDIEARSSGKSAMPEDAIKHLSKSELPDLVEFLAGLK